MISARRVNPSRVRDRSPSVEEGFQRDAGDTPAIHRWECVVVPLRIAGGPRVVQFAEERVRVVRREIARVRTLDDGGCPGREGFWIDPPRRLPSFPSVRDDAAPVVGPRWLFRAMGTALQGSGSLRRERRFGGPGFG